MPGFQLFQVPPAEDTDAKDLRVPAWLLNSHEWSSVTFASPKVQRPVLFDGLRNLRTGNPAEVGKEHCSVPSLHRAPRPDRGEEGGPA